MEPEDRQEYNSPHQCKKIKGNGMQCKQEAVKNDLCRKHARRADNRKNQEEDKSYPVLGGSVAGVVLTSFISTNPVTLIIAAAVGAAVALNALKEDKTDD